MLSAKENKSNFERKTITMRNVLVWAMIVILLTTGITVADINDGLVAYYPFNDTANDESGNGNHGTLMGNASAPGVLCLDGNEDYVFVPDSASLHLSTKGTIATLINLDSTIDVSHGKYVGIVTKMVGSTNPSQLEFELYYHPRLPVGDGSYVPLLEGFVCDNSHVDYARYTRMDPRDDTWHHLAMKWDSTVAKPYISLYLDGSLVDKRALTGSGITAKGFPMYIGRHKHDTTGLWYYFKGMIDEVRIYNRALSESEIEELALGDFQVDVDIDIKPGSCPNPLNVKDKGVLPVAVLGIKDFDVFNIDPASIRLEGVAPVRSSYEDVATPVSNKTDDCDCTTEGPDGYLDLLLKFDTQEIVAALGGVYDGDVFLLILTGEDLAGTPIEGTDCVVIIAKGGK